MIRLTDRAHALVAESLRSGDDALDGTAGRGHDTLFLARTVGATGRVIAFDLQEEAICSTRERLDAAGCLDRVRLCEMSHCEVTKVLHDEGVSQLGAAMFNLGYLPGSDHQVRTDLAGTLDALHQTRRHLRPGGILTVLGYRGHEGGEEEFRGVRDWFDARAGLGDRVVVEESTSSSARPGPVLLALRANAHARES